MKPDQLTVPETLIAHLASWLGQWPPPATLHVVGTSRRLEPAWDGNVNPGLAVGDPAHGAVLSVPPGKVEAVRHRAAAGGLTAVLAQLPHLLGMPGRVTYKAAFRWTSNPSPLPDVGHWLDVDQQEVPAWLRPFGGQVLVAADSDGAHLAGVGIKRHDHHGHELSVVTTPAARGQGLARALIAQAARRVLDEGAVPTYLHGLKNAASAHVADAAGFPDRGWTSFGISEAPTRNPRLTVYGTGWCPDVRRSRAVLDQARVPYDFVDLDHDIAATRLVRRLQNGKRHIPTLVWPDGQHLVEPTDDELLAQLATTAHHPDTEQDTKWSA